MKLDLLLDNLKSIQVSKLDDAVDRLHYLYTTILLVFFVFGIGLQQTFKDPLTCSLPANFPGKLLSQVNNYHTNLLLLFRHLGRIRQQLLLHQWDVSHSYGRWHERWQSWESAVSELLSGLSLFIIFTFWNGSLIRSILVGSVRACSSGVELLSSAFTLLAHGQVSCWWIECASNRGPLSQSVWEVDRGAEQGSQGSCSSDLRFDHIGARSWKARKTSTVGTQARVRLLGGQALQLVQSLLESLLAQQVHWRRRFFVGLQGADFYITIFHQLIRSPFSDCSQCNRWWLLGSNWVFPTRDLLRRWVQEAWYHAQASSSVFVGMLVLLAFKPIIFICLDDQHLDRESLRLALLLVHCTRDSDSSQSHLVILRVACSGSHTCLPHFEATFPDQEWISIFPRFQRTNHALVLDYAQKVHHREFCVKYLSRDGCLMIQFIEDHAGAVVASQLLEELAEMWSVRVDKSLGDLQQVVSDKNCWPCILQISSIILCYKLLYFLRNKRPFR